MACRVCTSARPGGAAGACPTPVVAPHAGAGATPCADDAALALALAEALNEGAPPTGSAGAVAAGAGKGPAPPLNVTMRPHGVVHLEGFLDPLEQRLIMEDCVERLRVKPIPGVAFPGKRSVTSGFAYGTRWAQKDANEREPACIERAMREHTRFIKENDALIDAVNELQRDRALRIPREFKSRSLFARMYGPHNGLGFHNDPPTNPWVIVVSLGADIDFVYHLGTAAGAGGYSSDGRSARAGGVKVHEVRIRSGDAVMFNGLKLAHAVARVGANVPPWWAEVTALAQTAAASGTRRFGQRGERGRGDANFTRIGLQMRLG